MAKSTSADVRLPKTVIPTRYAITMQPDLENFTFKGEETISVDVKKRVDSITLHSAELEILSVVFTGGGKSIEGTVTYDDKEELATLHFDRTLPVGKAKLSLTFTGILNDKMRGFYRSRYEHEGKPYHMAVTQFESTDARRAFPCFDEPAHKAVFEVSLIVPEDRVAISNMLETEIAEHSAGYKIVRFSPSPKMSSYLLAFIVGHFEHIQKKTKNGVLVRVFTTPGKKHQAAFALDCAVKCIEFYEKYFGIKYPLPVADLIAIPDFAAGAMENWGAVTYRETAVLVDPEHSSDQNRQRVALVIAHELAHQWFGNLVTMEWWTHLWLNEGFATYMEYVAINAVYPRWNIWSHFVSAEQSRALALDALKNTHAIEIDVEHPSEISEIFDAVSYSKGASVIRMLAAYLGEPAFRRGLVAYLKKHKYSNALTNDLWAALEKASGKPVMSVMKNWTRKPGYPVVTIGEDVKGVRWFQKRSFPNKSPQNKDATTWLVPLSLQTAKGKRKADLLKARAGIIPMKPAGFLKANPEETAFIRVRYTEANLALLAEEIKKGVRGPLTETDRFGIIRDAFAFAKSGELPTSVALNLLKAYVREPGYIVWAEITEHLLALKQLLFGTDLEEPFAVFARSVLAGKAQEVGWKKKKGEHPDMPFLRSAVLYAAGAFGDGEVVAKAHELFSKEKTKTGAIDPSLRAAVYVIAAQNGGKTEFAALRAMYASATLEEEKDRILRALASFKDPKMLTSVLDDAFSEGARGQDTLKAVSFVWGNPYGRTIAWEYLKSHWEIIEKRFAGGHLYPRFLAPAAHFTQIDEANDVHDFFAKRPAVGIARTIAQAIEQIRSKAGWFARDEENIRAFLKSR